jgi:hypothetical protein
VSLVLLLSTPHRALAGVPVDPNCRDQNGFPTAQFTSFVPASLLAQLLPVVQNELNNNFSIQIGPNAVVNGTTEQTLVVHVPQDVTNALQLGNITIPNIDQNNDVAINFPIPQITVPPFSVPYPLIVSSVSVNNFAITQVSNGISVSFGFTASASISSDQQLLVNMVISSGTVTALLHTDLLTRQLTVTVTDVQTQQSLGVGTAECVELTLETAGVGCALAEVALNAWASGNLAGVLQQTAQNGLNSLMGASSTQSLIMSAFSFLASFNPPQINVGSFFGGLGLIANAGSNLGSSDPDFQLYPTSLYIDPAGDICYAGAIGSGSGAPSANQFGPSGDPCAKARTQVLSDLVSFSPTLVVDIAQLQACEEPPCNPNNATSPLPVQFCAQGWEQPPTPTCTAKWSCYSPQDGDVSQVAISCNLAWPSGGEGQFGFQVWRDATTLAYSGPLGATVTVIDALPTFATYPANVSYSVKIVPDQFEAPADAWSAPPAATFSTVALNSCACEPLTCAALDESFSPQVACGILKDGCGGTSNCGTCPGTLQCIDNLCGAPPKQPPMHCKGTTCM